MVIDAGTVARDVLLLESVTTTPSAGAAAVSVTVAVVALPPESDADVSVTLLKAAAVVVEGDDGDPPQAEIMTAPSRTSGRTARPPCNAAATNARLRRCHVLFTHASHFGHGPTAIGRNRARTRRLFANQV